MCLNVHTVILRVFELYARNRDWICDYCFCELCFAWCCIRTTIWIAHDVIKRGFCVYTRSRAWCFDVNEKCFMLRYLWHRSWIRYAHCTKTLVNWVCIVECRCVRTWYFARRVSRWCCLHARRFSCTYRYLAGFCCVFVDVLSNVDMNWSGIFTFRCF